MHKSAEKSSIPDLHPKIGVKYHIDCLVFLGYSPLLCQDHGNLYTYIDIKVERDPHSDTSGENEATTAR